MPSSGPSGAGKTTLIRVLSLAISISSGSLMLNGQSAQRLPESALRALRREIGVVYQQHNLIRRLPVLHNVLAGQLGGWSLFRALRVLFRASVEEVHLALRALEQVDLIGKAKERPPALSGGQQQRVAIARVLAQAPNAILADEPVSSLDPGLAEDIIALLTGINERLGTTLIASLHNVELAMTYFPRVIGLQDGMIAFDRAPKNIASSDLKALFERNNGKPKQNSFNEDSK